MPTKLLFHSMHKRPMPGCLPLFFLVAAVVVGCIICMVQVTLPRQVRPKGVGNIYYRNDELTRFQVRQRSALPLRLPAFADPAAHQPIADHSLPLERKIGPLPAAPYSVTPQAPDSAVLDAEYLLALPPAEEAPAAAAPAEEETERGEP